jgi:hypothetical protein
VVRLYLTNTANTRVFNVSLFGAGMKLVGGDSGRYGFVQDDAAYLADGRPRRSLAPDASWPGAAPTAVGDRPSVTGAELAWSSRASTVQPSDSGFDDEADSAGGPRPRRRTGDDPTGANQPVGHRLRDHL